MYYKFSELNFEGKKSDLILDMCVKLGASAYVFGSLGRNYADVSQFKAHDIQVYFQDYQHPKYPQLYGPFESYLSIVDLLFNCGPHSLDILLAGNVTRPELVSLLLVKEK